MLRSAADYDLSGRATVTDSAGRRLRRPVDLQVELATVPGRVQYLVDCQSRVTSVGDGTGFVVTGLQRDRTVSGAVAVDHDVVIGEVSNRRRFSYCMRDAGGHDDSASATTIAY